MTAVAVIIPPQPLFDAAEAKRHLRVDDDDNLEDSEIEGFVAAATGLIDGPAGGWLGRALGRQTLELRMPGFPCDGRLCLPFVPIAQMVSVTYDNEAGSPQTLDPAAYALYGNHLMLTPGQTWPATAFNPESARFRYLAGYETVPAPILAAVKLMLGDLYRNRDSISLGSVSATPMPTTVERLLAPFRVWLG